MKTHLNIKHVKNNKLIHSTFIYLISRMIASSIPFLLLPVLTTYLSSEGFGLISMVSTVAAFCVPFVTFNLDGAIQRKYYDDNENIGEYIGNCVLIVLLFYIIVSVLFLLLNNQITRLTEIPKLFVPFIPLYCFSGFFISLILTLWQVREKPYKYGFFQISNTILELSFSIFLIVCLKYNWYGRVFSMFFINILFASLSYFYLKKNNLIIFCFNKSKFIHALKFGSGLIPHVIGGSLILLTNRFFITKMVNISETGQFAVAAQIASILSFFTLSFNNAYVPWLYKKLKLNSISDKIKIVKFTYLYLLLLLVFGVILYFVTPIMFSLFINSKFYYAQKFVPWIILGYVFQGGYFMVTNYIFYSEKTYIIATITIIIGLINIPLNYFCILNYGSLGAAISFATIFLLFFITTWLVSSKVYYMPWLLFKSKK